LAATRADFIRPRRRGRAAQAAVAALLVAAAALLAAPPTRAPDDPRAVLAAAPARLAGLEARTTRVKDEREIEHLQRIYGYYIDRMLWDEAADLFAENGTIEIGHSGVYVGQDRVRAYLHSLGPEGP